MPALTLVVAREDFSIPGAPKTGNGHACSAADVEAHFFDIVHQHNPDVIVLDLTGSARQATLTILKIRRRTRVPILVVCDPDDPRMREYTLAGAVQAMRTPVDITALNQTVQQIKRLSNGHGEAPAAEPSPGDPVCFSGLTLHPHNNRLVGTDGLATNLTTSENRVLVHFANNPWTLCTRDNLAEVLYGSRRPSSGRAIDVVVARLRKKIAILLGPAEQQVIKTESRRGYMFVVAVSRGATAADAPALQARIA